MEMEKWVENNCTGVGRVIKLGWFRWAENVAHTKMSEILTCRSQNFMGSGSVTGTEIELTQKLILAEQI